MNVWFISLPGMAKFSDRNLTLQAVPHKSFFFRSFKLVEGFWSRRLVSLLLANDGWLAVVYKRSEVAWDLLAQDQKIIVARDRQNLGDALAPCVESRMDCSQDPGFCNPGLRSESYLSCSNR